MNIIYKVFYSAVILLFAVAVSVVPAAANSVSGGGSILSGGSPDVPDADLEGWFFNGNSDFLFPTAIDPSQPWTSADNLAIISAWEALIFEANGDPALLAELVGMGMTTSSNMNTELSSLMTGVSAQDSVGAQNTNISNAPEPALLGLLGGGGTLLALIAAARVRRVNCGTCR